MGRARKDGDPFGLAGTRLAFKHGAFYYRHRDGRWEHVGTDVRKAKARANIYNSPSDNYGTMSYWLDQFLVNCESRVAAGDMAKRTKDDYTKDSVPLKVFFGSMLVEHIEPHHIQAYLDAGAKADRPVRANREKACLSSCISWLIRTNRTTLKINPCMQKSGTKENSESKRERYVTHEEYQQVWDAAGPQVRILMELTYRTLQRPESDIIYWTPKVLIRDPHSGARIITFEQGKTKTKLKIAMTETLEALINRATGPNPQMNQPLVHTQSGEGYTYSGITSMLTKAIQKVNAERRKKGLEEMLPFGYRDMKGKGATDMWLNGTPIEQIQLLCGHSDKSTTEKYIKARWNATAQPNELNLKLK
ncbi:tyrosine-type recombinase/integrase [Diaphorobacter caeni]|uniref:tyrosine-type recombinase/integrase n=1 Tax=Diaphorobacter caeni TaxID=2784387 RepID=UPI00188E708C|nr:tyrosine-type recombinase/integrase [Diaphorobacter caeni]MBF5006894.1 tyrosine-type recombinase/integrase [Diaphorobacter caeni]